MTQTNGQVQELQFPPTNVGSVERRIMSYVLMRFPGLTSYGSAVVTVISHGNLKT